MSSARYYFKLAWFRFREPFTDWKSTLVGHILFVFFVWFLSWMWLRFSAKNTQFTFQTILLYVGVTELLFLTFLRARSIQDGTEDFALFLARPRSWILRELFSHVGIAGGARLFYLLILVVITPFFGIPILPSLGFFARTLGLIILLAPAQALISTLFSALLLNFSQTRYFILPISKIFLSLGGVFGPVSDFGEPYRSIFLNLPGSDLFFQAAHIAIFGHPFEQSFAEWFLRILVICLGLYLCALFFYLRGRRRFEAWGG